MSIVTDGKASFDYGYLLTGKEHGFQVISAEGTLVKQDISIVARQVGKKV
jgi:hypothetical protein